MVQREKHSHFGGSAFFCRNDRGKPADTALFCGHGTPCPYRMCCKIARAVTKTIVQKQNDFRTVCPKRLLQLSAAGEVFLEGEQPSESLSADSEIPAPCFWRTGKVGEKSDSFSRAERTRPLRPCVPLAVSRFWKRSGGTFPTGYSFPETSGHGTPCPYRRILSLFCGRNTECFT